MWLLFDFMIAWVWYGFQWVCKELGFLDGEQGLFHLKYSPLPSSMLGDILLGLADYMEFDEATNGMDICLISPLSSFYGLTQNVSTPSEHADQDILSPEQHEKI